MKIWNLNFHTHRRNERNEGFYLTQPQKNDKSKEQVMGRGWNFEKKREIEEEGGKKEEFINYQ
jgi:hypothetical protein